MRKLLPLCCFALLATLLPAQKPVPSGTQPSTAPRNTSAPAPAKARTGSATLPAATERSNLQQSSNSRTNNTATQRTETTPNQLRQTNVAPANLTPNRPAPPPAKPSAAKPAGTTAKTVPAQMPAAPALKQAEPQIKVQWMTLEEALEKSKTEKRKIFIDVFTDWCGWCKRMDESTFTNPEVAQYLNDNYYAVKFNAEQQDDITFNNKTYHFRKNGARGYHELAAEWLNNRLSFPTVVFLDESTNLIQSIPTYLEAPKLETILNYFGTNSHKTTPWETYEKKYNDNQQR